MINRELRVYDMNGAQILHAEEIAPEDWRWTEPGLSGMNRGNWQAMITWADNVVAANDRADIQCGHYHVQLGPVSRNTWMDGEFLTPNQWLPRICPRKPEGEGDG
jgi:hypothetical protein